MALTIYNKKRDFKQTSEPVGKVSKESKLRFVIQRHHASHIHYDFRLEMGGALKSWAVPKGPSLNPAVKRLAMLVEDHPVSYIDFDGTIPAGNYGAGTVEVWDNGNYEPVDEDGKTITEKQALAAFKKGNLKFVLKGEKLKGSFALVNLKKDDGKSWLLIKHRDDFAMDEEYNSEDYSRDKHKEDTKADTKTKSTAKEVKKKPSPIDKGLSLGNKKINNFIKPMLASTSDAPFDNDEWLFELKLDGYRAIAELGDEVKLYSRNGLSFKNKYPPIVAALQQINHKATLDGEIVLLDEDGKPDFQKLQHYDDNTNYPLVYYVFDILMLNGESTIDFTLIERKQLLKELLGDNATIKYCDHIEDVGTAFYKKVVEQNMEGIMAKKKDGTYHIGIRSKEWLKIKNIQTHEAIIAGYTSPRGSREYFGALILGKYQDGELEYIGHTGTGFDAQALKDLWDQLQPLVTNDSPFKKKIKVNAPVTWVKPKLIAELHFTELTEGNIMRHPVFMRLRFDLDPKEITMKVSKETIASSTKITNPSEKEKKLPTEKKNLKQQKATTTPNDKLLTLKGKQLELTHLNKVFWPKEGYTKGDLIEYYDTISKYILPYLKNRPLSLKRNPNGITDDGFFHKDAGEAAPSWVEKADIHSDSSDKIIHYIVCNEEATLIYLANLGCIEINPWNSTTNNLQNPTYLVIDLDPSTKNTFSQVIAAALATKRVLDKAGADGYCKTSGATGLHIYIPMGNRYDYETVKNFAHIIATLVQEQLPSFTSLERSLAKRGDSNIYIDYLQNRTGQTLASVYSVRPKDGATVSTALTWDEVKEGLHPSQFTIKNTLERIKEKGDLFAPVLGKGIDINQCLENLGK